MISKQRVDEAHNGETTMTEAVKSTHHVSQFFAYHHLPEPLRSMSAKFARTHDAVFYPNNGRDALARLKGELEESLPLNPERDRCLIKMHVACNPGLDMAAQYCVKAERELILRMLLEAKDCAVRALIARDVTEENPVVVC